VLEPQSLSGLTGPVDYSNCFSASVSKNPRLFGKIPKSHIDPQILSSLEKITRSGDIFGDTFETTNDTQIGSGLGRDALLLHL